MARHLNSVSLAEPRRRATGFASLPPTVTTSTSQPQAPPYPILSPLNHLHSIQLVESRQLFALLLSTSLSLAHPALPVF
ncbi:hypothetical protein LshimejAT787_0200810 [Lyophyllum shimeji]|uniref:Uncharacterized protein n=1 Tax=Lyophyllum shimeji TaxID=47721 RepID=A0A9P3PFI4_LYOSH|nr:hypothetical protein LshimejAT787_0200810 [Lyophyllum shimeji]